MVDFARPDSNMKELRKNDDGSSWIKCHCGRKFLFAPDSNMLHAVYNKFGEIAPKCPGCNCIWDSEQFDGSEKKKFAIAYITVAKRSMDHKSIENERIPVAAGIYNSLVSWTSKILTQVPKDFLISKIEVLQVTEEEHDALLEEAISKQSKMLGIAILASIFLKDEDNDVRQNQEDDNSKG